MKWKGEADPSKEGPGGGGNGNFEPAPRGFYTIQVADYEDKESKKGRPMVMLVCEIADAGEHHGKKVWANITLIPKGEKWHGLMLHQLHAFGVELEGGPFEVDTAVLQGQQANVLLGVEQYTKEKDGVVYNNERNFVEEFYTEKHPQPAQLPEARERKQAAAKPATTGVKLKGTGAAVPAAIAKAFPGSRMVQEEVPF